MKISWPCSVNVVLTLCVSHRKTHISPIAISYQQSAKMAQLSEYEIQQLAAGIQKVLSRTVYACSSLDRIPGGSASFTYRGILQSPLALPDDTAITTVIIKKATDFAAINREFALDSSRSASSTSYCSLLHHLYKGLFQTDLRRRHAQSSLSYSA